MSKRNSIGSANTLFNYFTKTPPSTKKTIGEAKKALNSSACKDEVKSSKRDRPSLSPEPPHAEDSDEDIVVKKRKRIRPNPVDSDDSDVENKVNEVETPKEKSKFEKKLQDSFRYEPGDSPKSSKKKSATTKEKVQIKSEPQDEPIAADDGNWTHCKLEWLKPEKVRDAKRRRPNDPDYDPSTLYVPPEFLKSQTPAHRQWWDMKSTHFDCVLFFKVGKFYELYHMDAAVGVNELGFSYMKGEFAHSGFPESAYARMAATLVSKGYKVARVEQTETPDMMQERCKQMGTTSKFDKVVRREICQVAVRGAQACGLQDAGPADSGALYMMGLAEESTSVRRYGVCFVDTSIGQFYIGEFDDDKHSSRLLTTLAHYPPVLIVHDRRLCQHTSRLLATRWHGARREPRTLRDPEAVLKTLADNYYENAWPDGLQPLLSPRDALGLTPAPNCSLAIKALGACVTYLTECLLDLQVLTMGQFTRYTPPDVQTDTNTDTQEKSEWTGGNTMVLDAITLKNLRIVQDEGCLYDRLNFCSTPMGKRFLYQWVCSPSCNLTVIKERQEAVKYLFNDQQTCQDAKDILTSLPDLERLLSKVHTLGNLKRSKCHPDSRAIFYEEKTYTKRKVLDFIAVLNGFAAALNLMKLFSEVDSALIKRVSQFAPDGRYPDYRDTLKFFKEAFNQKEAEKEGHILPSAGVDQEYDHTLTLIKEIEGELQEYLTEQEKFFRCRVTYVGTDKKRYQLEVPLSAASRAGPDYQLEGARKGFKRFSTDETKELLERMIAAEEQKRNVLKDLSRRIFEKFSSHHSQWETAVQCVATLDVLLALAEFGRQQSGDVCVPDITCDDQPYIDIEEGRHPCITVEDFIPNGTTLRGDGRLLLLTGPNMGGKSTLMRQLGLITVLAHLGSYVPAARCSLSLVDRIFTRLGAADDILAGQSTFLVEMNETAAIVRHATPHSLVLLDELGRGTSTYDGAALACGVCAALAARSCRTVFSTHYHTLVHHLASAPGVLLSHMACMVETDETTDSDEIPEETITFLYKLSPGACPKSYGFNAARLAGIPRDITRRAQLVSRDLEKEAIAVRAFRTIVKTSNADSVREMLQTLVI
ncbi:probable DNA mismatch repair protein Msh6 isoform X2 [Aricia agestis]|uniref:probable DNA mismatch repair protein Msh6 isoform X2 n=1 Tax=Aricia agestis TaxID=91739 RepID=UPI001C20BF22|nr:probable DNA mismatch repair protein Msh6 isoform X2 [Aricia agestis]